MKLKHTPTPDNPAEMKRILGIDRMLLQVHASCFPVDSEEDFGRGTPYAHGADRLLDFAARLGFDAIQVGPMGLTERGNPSPYNGTLFSRNPLLLPLSRLVDRGLVQRADADAVLEQGRKCKGRSRYVDAFDASRRLAALICAGVHEKKRYPARRYLNDNASWIVPDALYDVLCARHRAAYWGDWGQTARGASDQRLFDPEPGRRRAAEERLHALRTRYSREVEDYALIQLALDEEHRAFRKRLVARKLALFGDLQIGLSPRDAWARKNLFLDGYRMGAPPSRTDPEGQPWNYPVYDPRLFGNPSRPGPVLLFVHSWLDRIFNEYDGIRIDHPHGWIDPWIYRTNQPDTYRAVQRGARLFSSPDESDHPELNIFAIADASQINRSETPYAEARVRSLTDQQVARYALLIDAIVRKASAHNRSTCDIACEILSTFPYTIRKVLERHRFGRFRVAQKAMLDDPADVYRIENALPEDWAMMSTHDTPGIWKLAQEWCLDGTAEKWGHYLAHRLVPESGRARFAAECGSGPGHLVHSLFAALMASRARNILVFFPDLFGMTERFNRPGEINDTNWMLRIPAGFETNYREACRRGAALDIHRCFRLALAARDKDFING